MTRTALPTHQRGRKVALYMTAKVRAQLSEKALTAGVSKPKAAALAILAWTPTPKPPSSPA